MNLYYVLSIDREVSTFERHATEILLASAAVPASAEINLKLKLSKKYSREFIALFRDKSLNPSSDWIHLERGTARYPPPPAPTPRALSRQDESHAPRLLLNSFLPRKLLETNRIGYRLGASL